MKIRISGNSVRLRLSQSEVGAFAEKGEVSDQVQFGPAPEAVLAYMLKCTDQPVLSATYSDQKITVLVPTEQGLNWAGAEQEVGIEHIHRFAGGNSLRILIEKDFKCLAERTFEDESDNFPNPNIC